MSSNDKLIIETPEQTVLEFPLAGIGSRALALAIDTLLQIGVLIVLGLVAALISYLGFLPQMGKQYVYAILIFAAFLSQFGYFAFFETIWNGQTPGKRWTRLRVITDSGRPVGAQGAILRNLMRIVDALPSLYAIGIVTSLISRESKRLGDYVAGTVVVHEKTLPGGASVWDAPPTNLLATPVSLVLTTGELQLVETFLERRSSLQEEVRRSMARQITDRLAQGRPDTPEPIQDPEKYLEALAEQSRNRAHFR
ncbi:MAG: RDD family protein [Acidobacteriia bacterium]|nr:RDD family protein [Terriglobia bacterium]